MKHLLLSTAIGLCVCSIPAFAALTESRSALNYAADQSVAPVAHHAPPTSTPPLQMHQHSGSVQHHSHGHHAHVRYHRIHHAHPQQTSRMKH